LSFLTHLKEIAIVLSASIGAFTFIVALLQYRRNSKLTRVEKFQEMRKAYLDRDCISRLLPLIETDDEALSHEPYQAKMTLLGFYEEIALLYKSKAIKRNVVHYMFGYYAIRCWESENFWQDLNRDSPYWALFKWFVDDMRRNEGKFKRDNVRSLSL